MKRLIILVFGFTVLISGCVTSHSFRDSKTRILPKTKILLDSIDKIAVVTFGFNYLDLEKFPVHPIELKSRPDSIFRYLNHKMSLAFGKQVNMLRKSSDCDYKVYKAIDETLFRSPVESLQKWSFFIDSFTLRNCVSFPDDKDILLIIFWLETREVGYSSLSVWDDFNGSFVLFREGKIEMYRRFRSYQLSQRRFFAKGSEDREDFPHFPQRQIERVVDALVEDLIKRVQ